MPHEMLHVKNKMRKTSGTWFYLLTDITEYHYSENK